jgi:RND family efflux transporter MFP subunit
MSRFRCFGRRRGLDAAPAALLFVSLGAACGGAPGTEVAPEPQEDVVVLGARDVATVTQTTVSPGIELTGSLAPYRQVDVRAQVPGVISGMRVDRGERVRQGQLMATIEAQGIQSQASSATAQIAGAESNVALARRRLESAEMLFSRGAIPELDFRAAQTQLEAAEAQLAATRAQAASARESAARTSIEAPIAGEISRRAASEGEAVQPGQTLFTIVDITTLELAGQAPVDEVANVRVGQPVEFALQAYPKRTFRGSVARIDPTADPATRQVGVFVQLPNPDRQLVGGLFATGKILTSAEREVLVVPENAVRRNGGTAFVWTIEHDVVARAVVETGLEDRSRGLVEITSGLALGTRVIIGPGAITEGARVRLAPGQAGTAGAADEGADEVERAARRAMKGGH